MTACKTQSQLVTLSLRPSFVPVFDLIHDFTQSFPPSLSLPVCLPVSTHTHPRTQRVAGADEEHVRIKRNLSLSLILVSCHRASPHDDDRVTRRLNFPPSPFFPSCPRLAYAIPSFTPSIHGLTFMLSSLSLPSCRLVWAPASASRRHYRSGSRTGEQSSGSRSDSTSRKDRPDLLIRAEDRVDTRPARRHTSRRSAVDPMDTFEDDVRAKIIALFFSHQRHRKHKFHT